MTTRVAVTGASGFVGRRLVRLLRDAGCHVAVLTRRPSAEVGTDLEARAWDAAAPAVPTEALRDIDVVCHLAAYLPPSYADAQYAQACLDVNALGTLRLLEAAVACGAPRFIHFSSGNVFRFQERPVKEDDPIYPAARAPYYLASKACGETWASHFGDSGKLSVCVLRPSSIYGAGMGGGVIPTFIERLRHGQAIDVADGGRYQTDFVHADDVARAALSAVLGSQEGSFNLGSGAPSTMLLLARTLVEVMGLPPERVCVQPASNGAPARGFAALDITRARTDLGFDPRSLADGLRTMVSATVATL